MEKIVFCFLVCFLASAMASYKLDSDLANEVMVQTELEMKASIFYQRYGHYFESKNQALHGIANFFFEQSLEEKKHADKLMTYLNQRDVRVGYSDSVGAFCSELDNTTFCYAVGNNTKSKDIGGITTAVLLAITDALKLEQKVYTKLEDIIKEKKDDPDHQLNHFLEHEYLDEQIESIKTLLDFQTQIQNIGTEYVGLLLFDRWLLDSKKTDL